MYCSQCGTKLLDSAKFCVECGKPVNAVESTQSQYPPEVCYIMLNGGGSGFMKNLLIISPLGPSDLNVTCWWEVKSEDGRLIAKSLSFPGKCDGIYYHYTDEQKVQAVELRKSLMKELQQKGWEYITDPRTGVPSTDTMIRRITK